MFELYLGRKAIERFQNAEEAATPTVTVTPTEAATTTITVTSTEEKTPIAKTIWTIVYVVLLVAIGAYSAYISWEANTLAGWGTVAKVLFSFFAFLFGLSYLITYFIHKLDLVNMILILKGEYQQYNGAV